MDLKIKFVSDVAEKIYNSGELLKYQTEGSSGIDLKAVSVFVPETKETITLESDKTNFILKPLSRVCVQTGISIGGLDKNYEIQIRPRSGLAFKNGITIVNAPGTIDSDYRGEIGAILCNLSNQDFIINQGDRIAQMIVCPIIKCNIQIVDEIDATSRGEGKFGSTGIKK